LATEVRVTLKDGRVLRQGMPEVAGSKSARATKNDVYEKFSILTRDCPKTQMDEMFERLQTLEQQAELDWISV
jgi:hypothetical protein